MDGSTPETLPQQRQQGLDVLSRAALQGHHKQAAYELGRLYSDRYLHEHNKDSSTALQWFHTALDLGEQRALVDLAYGYYEGDNHDGKNDAQAFRFAKQGADINDRYCQYVLGHLYLKGRGTSQNAIEAVKWLQCSADQGFAEAIEELAAVYLRGYGNVAKDYAKAYAICKRGLEYSLPFCQMTLADMYRHGWGTVRDYQQAFNYYQLAATHADPSPYAQHCLGEMFLNGEGVPQDVAVAEQWFTMASQQGYDPSNFKLQSLAKSKLSLQDLEVGMAPHSLVSTNIPPSPSTPTTPLSPTKSNRWSMNFFFQKKNVD
ncbi:HCP-like protein [Hesseltinella vesiculosa]|uniref:HCP-like protein n=1 Tax=Hesseltinella vesiculosa TaxID=101127 RepID=A0A1X2G741_9FUNG|nr:HCP-like protein [Hesseltinella vesiculosa]